MVHSKDTYVWEGIFLDALVYVAMIQITLGEVMNSILYDFLDYQLKQKVIRTIETTNSKSQQNLGGEEIKEQKLIMLLVGTLALFSLDPSLQPSGLFT